MAIEVIQTLTIQKDDAASSYETMQIKLRSDGSYEFVDAAGNTQTVHSDEKMRLLFEALSALSAV